jgi:heat shock protein HslJ
MGKYHDHGDDIMHDQNWLKYGAIALGALGFIVIVGFAMNAGGGIEGRTWIVQEMSVDGTTTTPISENPPYAEFVDGSVAGSSGCNTYSGGYEASGDAMIIGPLAATRMACIGPLQVQESVYFGLLDQVDTFDVSGDELTLSSGDTILIRYAEDSASD